MKFALFVRFCLFAYTAYHTDKSLGNIKSADAIKTQNIASSLTLCPALSDVFLLKTAVHKMGKKSHQNLAPF